MLSWGALGWHVRRIAILSRIPIQGGDQLILDWRILFETMLFQMKLIMLIAWVKPSMNRGNHPLTKPWCSQVFEPPVSRRRSHIFSHDFPIQPSIYDGQWIVPFQNCASAQRKKPFHAAEKSLRYSGEHEKEGRMCRITLAFIGF